MTKNYDIKETDDEVTIIIKDCTEFNIGAYTFPKYLLEGIAEVLAKYMKENITLTSNGKLLEGTLPCMCHVWINPDGSKHHNTGLNCLGGFNTELHDKCQMLYHSGINIKYIPWIVGKSKKQK